MQYDITDYEGCLIKLPKDIEDKILNYKFDLECIHPEKFITILGKYLRKNTLVDDETIEIIIMTLVRWWGCKCGYKMVVLEMIMEKGYVTEPMVYPRPMGRTAMMMRILHDLINVRDDPLVMVTREKIWKLYRDWCYHNKIMKTELWDRLPRSSRPYMLRSCKYPYW